MRKFHASCCLLIVLSFFVDKIDSQTISGSLSLCNLGGSIGGGSIGGGGTGGTDDTVNPSRIADFSGGYYPTDFGVRHNTHMYNIQQTIDINQPQDMPAVIDIIASEINKPCNGDLQCEEIINSTIDNALDYIIEERTTYSENKGKRKLHEMIPGYNLGEEITNILNEVMTHIDNEDDEEILRQLDNMLDGVYKNDKLSEHEKHIAVGAISIAKGSTEYWFEMFRSEDHVYRRLKDSSSQTKNENVNLFDCVMGRGRLWDNKCCEDSEDSEDRDDRERHLRGGGGLGKKLSKAVNNAMTQHIPLSVRLKRDLQYSYNDDDGRYPSRYPQDNGYGGYSYDDGYNYGGGNGGGYDNGYNHGGNGGGYYRPVDDDYRGGGGGGYNRPGGGGSGNRYDDDDDRFPGYYDDDRNQGNGPPNGSMPPNGSSSSSSSSSCEGCGKWIRRATWLWFLIRADVAGGIAGLVLPPACIPVAVASAVSFSSTYVICY